MKDTENPLPSSTTSGQSPASRIIIPVINEEPPGARGLLSQRSSLPVLISMGERENAPMFFPMRPMILPGMMPGMMPAMMPARPTPYSGQRISFMSTYPSSMPAPLIPISGLLPPPPFNYYPAMRSIWPSIIFLLGTF